MTLEQWSKSNLTGILFFEEEKLNRHVFNMDSLFFSLLVIYEYFLKSLCRFLRWKCDKTCQIETSNSNVNESKIIGLFKFLIFSFY
jgi:hypothetical protein